MGVSIYGFGDGRSRDTVVFSALGYKPVRISVKDLLIREQIRVYLSENIYDLSEIVVIESRTRKRLINMGNPFFQGGALYADNIQSGAAMALYINNLNRKGKEKYAYPIYLEDASITIFQNTFESFKVRIRILDAVGKNGKPYPGTDLIQESIVIESTHLRAG